MSSRFYTNSELRLWQRCPRKWMLGQHRGLVRAGANEFNKPLSLGTRVHDALEVYYSPTDSTDPLVWLDSSLRSDLEICPEDQHEDIRKEVELARIMLEGYVEWLEETGADQGLTVLEAERARYARLEPDKDRFLLAKLDARVSHDVFGERISIDHKTTASLDALLPELRLNTQALTQHLIEKLINAESGSDPDARPTGTLFNFLKKVKRTSRAKPPFYSREFARHTDSELRNHWRHIVALADQIEDAERRLESGEDHHLVAPPCPTSSCRWECSFFHLCPMMDNDRDDSAGYQRDYFVTEDPLKRYSGLLNGETG